MGGTIEARVIAAIICCNGDGVEMARPFTSGNEAAATSGSHAVILECDDGIGPAAGEILFGGSGDGRIGAGKKTKSSSERGRKGLYHRGRAAASAIGARQS